MAEQLTLTLKPRSVLGKAVRLLRQEGITPVHLYGPGLTSLPLQCDTPSLLRVMVEAGANTPVSIQVEGEKGEQLAFVREIQWHPVRGSLLHVDFLATELTTRVTAEVPIVLVGISEGDRVAGGTLAHNLRLLQVEALPMDLPRELTVDAADVSDPERIFRAGDISLPANVILIANAEEPVARIEFVREEEAVAVEEEGVSVEEISAEETSQQGTSEGEEQPG